MKREAKLAIAWNMECGRGLFRGSGWGNQHLDLGFWREIGIGELLSLWIRFSNRKQEGRDVEN